jgi:uncharacterized membrane protein
MTFKIRFITSSLIMIWLIGIFIAWLIPVNEKLLFIYPYLKQGYSVVCHQESCKLITVNGKESLVCSRCAGIYSGLFMSSIILLFNKSIKKPKLKILLVVSLPMLMDVIFHSIGLYNYSKTIAFLTGFLLGSVGFLYFYSGLNELIIEQKVRAK